MELSYYALVGAPNCGKTVLFNGLTGAHAKVANYPGVTVDKREGAFLMMRLSVLLTCPVHTACVQPALTRRWREIWSWVRWVFRLMP